MAGRPIRHEDVAPETVLAGLLEAGLPRPYAEFMLVIMGFFKAGYSERVTGAVQEITGRAPRSFESYANDHAAAWKAQAVT